MNIHLLSTPVVFSGSNPKIREYKMAANDDHALE
jgi:hypothetical protein